MTAPQSGGERPGLRIDRAAPGERPLIESLLQLYTHDFSAFWTGRPEGELDEDGRFPAYAPLPLYWRGPARIPLVFRLEGRPVGFALINAHSHLGRPVERAMAEFFVVRKHRRTGLGRAAAQAIFSLYPGSWEVAVARANRPALAFWKATIASHPGAHAIEAIEVSGPEWDGPVFRFVIRPG